MYLLSCFLCDLSLLYAESFGHQMDELAYASIVVSMVALNQAEVVDQVLTAIKTLTNTKLKNSCLQFLIKIW
jgi:hypothetical protein